MIARSSLTLALLASVSLLASCVSTTRNLDPNESFHYDAGYDFSDKKAIVDDLTNSLLNTANLPTANDKPILIIYGVANQTSEHIDTGGITDDIQNALLASGRYRFISQAQRNNILREVNYQTGGNVDPAQIIELGRQTGAEYILGGTLRSIEKKQPRQWRLNRREIVYYSLNLELTSLTTGEISWADSVELAREASRPIIGW